MLEKIKNKPWISYAFLALASIVVILPFLWVIMASFKTNGEYMMDPVSFPVSFHFQNYIDAFQSIHMLTLFKNSLLIATVSVLGCLLLVSMASYALSRFTLRINKWIYSYFLLGLMIPVNAAIIPLYIAMKKVGLLDTYAAVIIPYIAFNIPMGIFLITNYMRTIPRELEEAAIIDGCNIFKLFSHVMFPLSRPIFATYSIITFIGLWNEFTFSLVFLSGQEMRTVPIGLASFRGEFETNTPAMLAGTVIAVIPVLIVFVLLRKQILQGMTTGAVKG